MKAGMEQNDPFVASKLALLNGETALDATQVNDAWLRLRPSLARRKRPAIPRHRVSAAAAALVVITISSPVLTAWAQNLWARFVLSRTASIELDLTLATPNLLLPNVFPFYPQNRNQRWEVKSAADASALAGYEAKILNSPSLPAPTIQVVATPTVRHVFDVKSVEADLRRLGRALPAVPSGLNNAEIVLAPQGRSVWSFYGDCPELIGPGKACAMLIQSPPMTLLLPPAVSREEYTKFSLELAGLAPESARTLALWSRTQPTLFLPLEVKSELRRVRVGEREGTLIVYSADAAETAFALDWQEDNSSYRLYGRGPETAISLAESLR